MLAILLGGTENRFRTDKPKTSQNSFIIDNVIEQTEILLFQTKFCLNLKFDDFSIRKERQQ